MSFKQDKNIDEVAERGDFLVISLKSRILLQSIYNLIYEDSNKIPHENKEIVVHIKRTLKYFGRNVVHKTDCWGILL